ncbi:WecB/TagA/CpsF family glycosyltransferase [Balneolaceae bacterium YR4-1]|uniref:WecB/TagA/CpsF family glycosyltransferase n=1 Tax=Halalkalibaculum roseum TaxID=2709311 RepID=A0A6M1SUZ1_9BACT|nr:WecB/TagA/CpsF family glycosyltransferase [Halalkalibaculum roseum]NGP75948.1 WecB/TagA/CpsF family glycosyltransferase [Halalkalibaculum roseum]
MILFDYPIHLSYPDYPFEGKKIINTINPHSYCVAKKDKNFEKALKDSDRLIPDGAGIVWAARLLKGEKIERITGADMHAYLLSQAQEHSLKVYYLGSTEETLQKIEERISVEYPAVKVGSFSPPFKQVFSENDNDKMIEKVKAFSPDILFVGMTAPKQEKWAHQHKEDLNASVICSIGAVFDFFAGTVQRSPEWMQNLGLEWLHRSLKSPRRLGKRNLRSNPEFVLDVLKSKFGFNI